MKKILSLVLCAALAASLLAGCSSNLPKGHNPLEQTTEPTGTAESTGALKTGLAVLSGTSKSVAPADGKNGTAQMDTTVVAVLVDASGVIVDCKIDGVQTKVEFDATGKIVTALDEKVPSKNELGTGYGMGKVSSIGKEWNEQAAALAAYAIGKTVDEVKGVAMDETTKPTGADLASSVTISIGGFLPAIEKAVANAQDLGAQAGDKLGLGTDTNIAKSKDAGEKDGVAQAYSIYTASSFDASGKITSCVLDGSQTNVNFNTKGAITSDLTAATKTKNELKEDYNMKGSSGIGKEWYEQAAAYAAYVTGKTLAEVNGVAVDETGHATGADLAASVTVSIGAFNACLSRAAQNAGVAAAPAATGALKTGLAILGDAGKSVAPADGKNGTAQMDTTVVAVLVDASGVIVDCKIDGVQTKVEFDATGKIVTALDEKVSSKNELGTGYGMGKVSSIGKEWNEQAAALAAYAIGKTVDEVKGVAMDETTKPTGADLASSVTISIGGFLPAIEKAVANAQDLGAQAGDKLGLGIDTNIAKSKDAGEKDGVAQAYSIYTASSFDASGKITSCVLDGSQTNVNFNTKGEITNDIMAPVQSKNELKEAYNMKGSSGIGLEWYQQAANYAAYVIGKTVAEVNGVAMDETGHATGADLTSSVTVSIGAFNTCLEKAAKNAG